jgi:hypothetical protein
MKLTQSVAGGFRLSSKCPYQTKEDQKSNEPFHFQSVWRPLSESLRDWPLALCDARSVQPEDMVESDLIWPGYLGENLFLYFNPHYKFYFLDKQTRDEVWIFKQFDTNECVARSKLCLFDGRSDKNH